MDFYFLINCSTSLYNRPLYFLIPRTKFSSRHSYWKCSILLLLMVFVMWCVWSLTFLMIHIPSFASEMDSTFSSYEQTVYVFNHPIKIFVRLANTIPLDIIMTFFLGCSDVRDTYKVMLPYIFLLILPAFSRNEDYIWRNLGKNIWYHIILLSGIFSVLFILMHLAIFITWPQPVQDIIFGVHGRYFIPFIILLVVVDSQVFKVMKFISDIEKMAALYYIGLPCMLGLSVFWIWQRYYG